MKQEYLQIKHIPAVIWGEQADKVIIAVHGSMSHKEDLPIQIVAEVANSYGYQVISFDLPEHGARKQEQTLCKVQVCEKELAEIYAYTQRSWKQISLFANSLGAYISLMSYQNVRLECAWFLSPLIDMVRMIENMMSWYSISENELRDKQEFVTPVGQVLYWDYYCYVKEHPITTWNVKTYMLYGELDETCEKDTIVHFQKQFNCTLEIVNQASHYFHTEKELDTLRYWLEKTIS